MEYLIFSTLWIRYLKIHFTNKRNKIRRLYAMESSCSGEMQKPEFYTGFQTSNSFTACEFLKPKKWRCKVGMKGEMEFVYVTLI